MRRLTLLLAAGIAVLAPIVLAQSTGLYKVIKTARVGGEGGTDYIYADTVGRRLYITRGATQARDATATTPAVPAFEKRLRIVDLDTLEPVGVIPGVGGNGATVCPSTGHGIDSKTGHLFAMASEFGPPPPPPPAGTPPPAGGRGAGRGPAIPDSFTIIMVGR